LQNGWQFRELNCNFSLKLSKEPTKSTPTILHAGHKSIPHSSTHTTNPNVPSSE